MNSPVDTSDVRRHNLSLVLRHIAAQQPCARTEIAAGTGLGHGSVTGLVADLLERGLVSEVETLPAEASASASAGRPKPSGRGRPRRLLALALGRVATVAVQVTQEGVHVMVADVAGPVLHRDSVPHHAPYGDPEPLAAVIAQVVARARAAVAEAGHGIRLARTVIAMPGPIAGPTQTVAAAIDFGWRGIDLRGLVTAQLVRLADAAGSVRPGDAAVGQSGDAPLDVVNDANAAALAEYHALEGLGVEHPDTVVYIKADTGVGGCLLIDRRIHRGSHGVAGEVGHIPLDLNGPPCACGARGCLAGYIGPEPLTRAAGLGGLAGAEGPEAALAELDRRLRAGDPAAVAALDAAARVLGAAVLAVNGLADAGEIILGGYLATWGERLLPGIDERLADRRAVAGAVIPVVRLGVLGAEAALRGATQLGRDAVLDDPTTVPAR